MAVLSAYAGADIAAGEEVTIRYVHALKGEHVSSDIAVVEGRARGGR